MPCRVVIRYDAISAWRDRDKRRQREISLEYLTEENFIHFGKVSAGEWGGCMASSGIISARASMAFSTAFSLVSLNIGMTIFAINLTSCYVACPPKRNWNRTAISRCLMLSLVSLLTCPFSRAASRIRLL